MTPQMLAQTTHSESQSAAADYVDLVALEQRWEKTRALRQAMMQELLTGKTRLI